MTPNLDHLQREAVAQFGAPESSPAPVAPATASTAPAPATPTATTTPSATATAVTAAPAPAAIEAVPGAGMITDPRRKGWNLDVTVKPTEVVAAAGWLDQYGFAIDAVTGVDWMAQAQMEVVYDFFHPTAPLRVVVRTRIPRECPELPTISGVFPGANWHERETHDFFGIRFLGHPDLSPLLLPEDANYHPLRKDFVCAA